MLFDYTFDWLCLMMKNDHITLMFYILLVDELMNNLKTNKFVIRKWLANRLNKFGMYNCYIFYGLGQRQRWSGGKGG